MKTNKRLPLMFSSATAEWSTPQLLFDKLNAVWNFNLDVCATKTNAKCARFFTTEQNALLQPWVGRCWMNPPYGRGIGLWVKKALSSAVDQTAVVCLLPARTDTAWWHEYVTRGKIEFLRGRLKFSGHKHNAPFPSAIVVFGDEDLSADGSIP